MAGVERPPGFWRRLIGAGSPATAPSLLLAGGRRLVAPPSRGGRPHATCRLQLPGDHYLWTCFAREAELAVVESTLGGFPCPARVEGDDPLPEEHKELSTRAGPVDLLRPPSSFPCFWRLPEVDPPLRGAARWVVRAEGRPGARLSPIDAAEARKRERPMAERTSRGLPSRPRRRALGVAPPESVWQRRYAAAREASPSSERARHRARDRARDRPAHGALPWARSGSAPG